jgi:pyrroline-5-carboxylate reductase
LGKYNKILAIISTACRLFIQGMVYTEKRLKLIFSNIGESDQHQRSFHERDSNVYCEASHFPYKKKFELMVWRNNDHPVNETIGIIGAGHLGRTLAETFVEHGFPKERLMISYGGKLSTLESIKKAGLGGNVADNVEICQKSTVMFIALKPQSLKELKNLPFTSNSLIVSCMAGISLASLKATLGVDVFRIMTSGPNTIKEKKGIAAVYPQNDFLTDILSFIGLKAQKLQNEEIMHVFTVGVCLPAAILIANKRGLNVELESAVEVIEKEYAGFMDIFIWAENVLPDFDSNKEQTKYIDNMCTRGGITEEIVNSLNSGSTVMDALRKGIAKSEEISSFARLALSS